MFGAQMIANEFNELLILGNTESWDRKLYPLGLYLNVSLQLKGQGDPNSQEKWQILATWQGE